ncbi:hypothetical protein [Hymenobacter cavernae]|uniref:DUF4421 domain-containing protein n=1 Tax=Hymenobacter cavernae TaxID=2044852 RepID=A0ABQ1UF09_9BACT|nr:hypothetical protein [Hymenobacter cavernae]GGF16496.1 hypothetical protein GCM10011383_29870 [Hymenobacter cavernae]
MGIHFSDPPVANCFTRTSLLLGLCLLLGLAPNARAQLDNRAFLYPLTVRPAYDHQLRLSVNAFQFFKDNEYFNKIADGYTLFGTQFNPRLTYFPSPNLRVEAGVFLWKDYGNPRLQQVRPTFTAVYQSPNGKNRVLFGNIESHLHHGYIEPLFDFERVILKRLEEGLQYQFQARHVRLDTWVDWQRQQYRYSNYQEEITGGLASEFILTPDSTRNWRFSVPVQFTAQHHGGQIDTLDKPLQTLFNYSLGLRVARQLPSRTVQRLRAEAYGAFFDDHSFTKAYPYSSGTGLYLNAGADTRFVNVLLSYWQGNHFVAPLGGRLYQSVSTTVANPQFTDANRKILLVRFLRDFRLPGHVVLSTRLEPVYDFNAHLLDFSCGVYLNFNQEFFLAKLRASTSD